MTKKLACLGIVSEFDPFSDCGQLQVWLDGVLFSVDNFRSDRTVCFVTKY